MSFQDELILQRILVKLFHIEEAIENNTRVVFKNKELTGLREEQRVHDNALEAARTEQTKARTTVMQKEEGIKKAEKALDGKVCWLYHPILLSLIVTSCRNLNSSRSRLILRMLPGR